MIPGFEFATAGRIRFGEGTAKELPALASALGMRALVVTGSDPARSGHLQQALIDELAVVGTFAVAGEPDVDTINQGLERAREIEADLIIGYGGGSAIDAGKAIAALVTNPGEALDYLEVVGKGQPLREPSAPYIAVPTTAGTGAEVTRNAVLGVPEHQVKVSMRSPHMLPTIAVVDPLLTHSLPAGPTASTGLDALTQLIEPFTCLRATPMTDALCREAIPRAARALPRVIEHPEDADARSDMALASLFGGLALANAGLGAAHGFAGPLGGRYDAPHGQLCAVLLPQVMKTNHHALMRKDPESEILARFDEVARMLTGSDRARAPDGIRWISSLVDRLSLPSLATFGVQREHFSELVANAKRASSMKANPVALDDAELTGILEAAL